jgi:homospermidine synthase
LFLSLRFPHQNPVRIIPLPHTCYMPAHLIRGLITQIFGKDYLDQPMHNVYINNEFVYR